MLAVAQRGVEDAHTTVVGRNVAKARRTYRPARPAVHGRPGHVAPLRDPLERLLQPGIPTVSRDVGAHEAKRVGVLGRRRHQVFPVLGTQRLEPDMAAFEDDRLRPLHAPILPGAQIGAPP